MRFRGSLVEMGGIEPPSDDRPRGLLRAHPAIDFSACDVMQACCQRSSVDEVSEHAHRHGAHPVAPLNDARHQTEGTTWADGLKVHAAISGGENVVGAVLFGTYWFARSVNELSAHSRPASPRSTTAVETDHPLLSSSLTGKQTAGLALQRSSKTHRRTVSNRSAGRLRITPLTRSFNS